MLLSMLRKMIEIRRFEERVERLFLQEGALIGPSHLYLGEEAVAAGAIGALNENDLITSTYRGHGHAIAKGVPMKPLMAELFGKSTGTCKGAVFWQLNITGFKLLLNLHSTSNCIDHASKLSENIVSWSIHHSASLLLDEA